MKIEMKIKWVFNAHNRVLENLILSIARVIVSYMAYSIVG